MLLRRITKHVRDQNWFAVFIDFIIVVVGILIAFQITEWSEQRQEASLEIIYLNRLVVDLDETINYLDSQNQQQVKIKENIESALATLNNSETSDQELIAATRLYISKGTALGGFKVTRNTFDDLQSTGNLSLITNEELVKSLGQLHTNFTENNLAALVNSDWVNPFESKITWEMDFLRFDSATEHLFPKKNTAEIAQHIRENSELLTRHASLHYWYVATISDDYKSAGEEAMVVRAMIKDELERR